MPLDEPKPQSKKHQKEEPEMPLDMNSSTAVLDDEAPIEAAHSKKHQSFSNVQAAKTSTSRMSADDTDNDKQ